MPKLSEIEAMIQERIRNAERHMPEAEEFDRFWTLVVELREHDQVIPLGRYPGVWTRKIDDQWTLICNGHPETDKETNIPGLSCYVQFNGWPAGCIGVDGSTFAAGSLANLKTFNDAMDAVLHEKKESTDEKRETAG